jgi:hypothetical protein
MSDALQLTMLARIHRHFVPTIYSFYSISSGDSDLIGVEENPEFRQHGRSGLGNDGFTSDLATDRRMSINPMVASGLNQVSAAALQENPTVGRSMNPLAGTQNPYGYDSFDDDDDAANDSRRSSEIGAYQNNNFTFNGRMDSTPTTEL